MSAPRATVRLQFHAGFTLVDALAVVPYYAALGVSHVYASPLLASQPGSMHGYDGIAHDRIDTELGGEPALRALVAALRAHGMGLVLDIVPNHMSASLENPWWHDVLEHGTASEFAQYFDIAWEAGDGRVLLPWLPQPLADVVAEADLSLHWSDAQRRIHVHAGSARVPLAASSYAAVLGAGSDPALAPFAARFAAAQRGAFDAAREALAVTAAADPRLHSAIEAALERFLPVDGPGRERLRELLANQPWRLSDWRAAPQRINWRRFFDIGALVALRVDLPAVFDAVHAYPLELFAQGLIDGLRIDHVDGLRDPGGYCRRLRAQLQRHAARRPAPLPQRAWLVVEKILAADEPLRADWPVDGSTGYDFMEQVGALLHAAQGEAALDAAWRAMGGVEPFAAVALQARRETLQRSFAADFARALEQLAPLVHAAADAPQLRQAATALVVHFPVYRTYISRDACSALDWALLLSAATAAQAELGSEPWLLLQGLLQALRGQSGAAAELREQGLAALQQLCPPIAAKAIEDTAFYRFGRLLSRNEVGGDPGLLALPVAAFHAHCEARARLWPRAMLACATHDHKRGEDVRARLAVLSECAPWWNEHLQRWVRWPLAAPDASPTPDPRDRCMLLQTLLGAWPLRLQPGDADGIAELAQRLGEWQRKALREAKQRSSWSAPDHAYEQACEQLLQALLADAAFVGELHAAVLRIAPAGALNGLAQTLLRLTVPGVPDLYQGTELWDESLVDPDNRRAVDHAGRSRALAADEDDAALLAAWRDGRIKQRLIARALAARRQCPALFAEGDYLPLRLHGACAGEAIAFLRRWRGQAALVVAPLHALRLLEGDTLPRVPPAAWADTQVELPQDPPRAWCDALGGGPVELHDPGLPLARVLHEWPVALWLAG